jgi:hypothetical protein
MSAVLATLNIWLFPGCTPLLRSTSVRLSRTLTTWRETGERGSVWW